MATKSAIIFDLNLFSGSSEKTRQEFGGYYRDEDGQGDIEFYDAVISRPSQIHTLESYGYGSYTDFILPRIIYPNRIFSTTDTSIRTDDEWKAYIVGGTFADITYQGIYNSVVYTDHASATPLAYTPRETINTALESSISLTTEYYNQYARYQAKVSNLASELMAPNFYTLDPSLNLLNPADADETSTIASVRYLNMIEYLTNTFPNEDTIMDNNMENVFVINPSVDLAPYKENRMDTNDLVQSGKFDSDLEKTYSLLPYGNKFVVEQDMTNPLESLSRGGTYPGNLRFKTLMQNNQFQVKFLKMLKETFQGESELETQTVDFGININQRLETGIETTITQAIKLVDLPTMILSSYKNPVSQNSNITVINSSSYQSQIEYAFDETGIYRYENTQKSLQILNTFMDEIKQIFQNRIDDESITEFDNFLNIANDMGKKYNETVAFRIQKIGGPPSGDLSTQSTIQNIWFFNSKEAFTYFDTQVKYDTEYTYKIYKYVIVQGYKYQLSDISVTKQLSKEGATFCLQFYDPFTGEVVPQITSSETLLSKYEQNEEIRETIKDEQDNLEELQDELTLLQVRHSAEKTSTGFSISNDFPTTSLELIHLYNTMYPNFLLTLENDNINRLFRLRALYQEILSSGAIPDDSKIAEIDPDNLIFGSVSNLRIWLDDVDALLGFVSIRDYISILSSYNTGYILLLGEFSRALSDIADKEGDILELEGQLSPFENRTDDNTRLFSIYPHLAEFNTTIEPSIKIVEIPIEEKSMRIVDHPPNDFVVTPHHLLNQSNQLAFYMKYDTFSKNEVSYPYPLSQADLMNKSAYLVGHEFVESSTLTQETPSAISQIEVFRIQKKPTSYEDFVGASRKRINLTQPNGDIASDHLFVERVRENIKYYYVFRAVNANGVGGQLSPVFEAELVNDGGYVYGLFNQLSEQDLAVKAPKEPLLAFKKLINIVPNIQHLQLNTSDVDFSNSSLSEIGEIRLGDSNVVDPLFNSDLDRYFKIRLTSKKTGRKLDLNIGFNKATKK
tara:strand:- start:2038 stop:5097 length:3060 start_codon:yes stop_codon:yes gene_type:complete